MSEATSRMSKVKQKDTGPEMLVRRALWSRGLRYRLHAKSLPGTPDIVFPGARVVVFVHGCYWHRHTACRLATMPKSNQEFWSTKFARNIERDESVVARLTSGGWRCGVVWQCEAENAKLLIEKVNEIEALVRNTSHS